MAVNTLHYDMLQLQKSAVIFNLPHEWDNVDNSLIPRLDFFNAQVEGLGARELNFINYLIPSTSMVMYTIHKHYNDN